MNMSFRSFLLIITIIIIIKALIFLQIVNLKAPYETNCTNRSLDMFNSDVYAYTKRACMIKCRNDYTVKRCGCTTPEFKGIVMALHFLH